MGTVRKIGDEYYIEFEARGLKYQQKAGPDKTAAEKMLADVEGKIRQGEMGTMVRDADVRVFCEDFLEFAGREYPAATVRRLERLIAHFRQWLADKNPAIEKLSQVTPKVVEEYKFFLLERLKGERESKKAAVVNLTLILLSVFFEYAIRTNFLNDNPTLHIRFAAWSRRRGISDPVRSEMFRRLRDLILNGVSSEKIFKLSGHRDIARLLGYVPFFSERQKNLY